MIRAPTFHLKLLVSENFQEAFSGLCSPFPTGLGDWILSCVHSCGPAIPDDRVMLSAMPCSLVV